MKQKLLDVAISKSIEVGYQNVTRKEIAKKARVSTALISYYFKNVKGLRRAIVLKAIHENVLPIILQVLIHRDPLLIHIPRELRARAENYLVDY